MSLRKKSRAIRRVLDSFIREPARSASGLDGLRETVQGRLFAERWQRPGTPQRSAPPGSPGDGGDGDGDNPLRAFFESRRAGRGIWKWTHYFEIYHRHLQRFVGRELSIVEVGVFGGGSLEMWKAYFGAKCRVYGVDIEPACKAYEDERTRIFVGDQADRAFWRAFREQVPHVDILVDDGGHLPEQQRVTLEEMLPHLRPGGVFLCEDVHGTDNRFASYVAGLCSELHAAQDPSRPGEALSVQATPFQQEIASIHVYPFVTVIEKQTSRRERLTAPQHGTEWQPPL